MRKRRFTTLLSVICVGIIYAYWGLLNIRPLDSGSFDDAIEDTRTISKTPNGQIPLTPWCQPEECVVGSWKLREPAFKNLQELQAAYANSIWPTWAYCNSKNDPEAEGQRLVQIMNWIWAPDVGQMRNWNAEEFVVRLLRSPGGMIFIGDSLTNQHFNELGYTLRAAGIDFDEDPPHLPFHEHKRVHLLILKRNSPVTRRLHERAGVPIMRLNRPVLTSLEDYMLLHEQDVRDITERYGAAKDYHWHLNMPMVEDWEGYVRNASQPLEGEDTVKEDTVVVMNTGAHWSRGTLDMLPNRATNKTEQDIVYQVFLEMTTVIVKRIVSIPRLSIYYRPTHPAHPTCTQLSKPYPNATVARESEQNIPERLTANIDSEEERRIRRRWDWDRFESHNEIWRSAIITVMKQRAKMSRTRKVESARWFYLDVWEMSLQRGDAHSEPGRDCLHWCLPAVAEVWTQYINHLLFLDSEDQHGYFLEQF